MSYNLNSHLFSETQVAAADLSTKQFYAITDGNVATAAKNMNGILQNNPVLGGSATVQNGGFTKAAITANVSITKGALLEVDTNGTFKTLAGGTAVARAEEAVTGAVGVIGIITVRILPSNSAFA
jgi:hypothetical protein